MNSNTPYRVLMVCTGNICRSPTAHGVLEKMVTHAGLQTSIQVDSAGTHSYHVGEAPDGRSQQHALRRGYDLSHQRARQLTAQDFDDFDLVLFMGCRTRVNRLFMEFLHRARHPGLFLSSGVKRRLIADHLRALAAYGFAQGFAAQGRARIAQRAQQHTALQHGHGQRVVAELIERQTRRPVRDLFDGGATLPALAANCPALLTPKPCSVPTRVIFPAYMPPRAAVSMA